MTLDLVRWDREHKRLWVVSQRSHHGAWGVMCIVLGGVLCIHDRKDYKDWFRLGP